MKSICKRFALFTVSLWLGSTCWAGTDLSITAGVSYYTCSADNTSAMVNVGVVLTTSGSTAPTSVETSKDGGATFTPQATITNFQGTGRDKKAELTIAETLSANIPTAYEVCAEQPGNLDKSDCADISITPSCVPPSCIAAGKQCSASGVKCCYDLPCEGGVCTIIQ
jgi:hypothetical protein